MNNPIWSPNFFLAHKVYKFENQQNQDVRIGQETEVKSSLGHEGMREIAFTKKNVIITVDIFIVQDLSSRVVLAVVILLV